jgi:hypothetical protein
MSNLENPMLEVLRKYTLGFCHYKTNYAYPPGLVDGIKNKEAFAIDVKKRLAYQIGEHIISKNLGIKEDGYNTSIELMIMTMSDFKTCVEACISILTEEQIQLIREGKL